MRTVLYQLAALLLVLATGAGCFPGPGQNAEMDLVDIPKIDVHTHYNYARDYLVPLLDEWNMKAAVVEVVTDPSRPRWEVMNTHYRQFPEHLILCTSFDASGIDDAGFARDVVASLKEDLAAGAKMVKVWKNIGMVYRDASGAFIQVDDPRFQPIWNFLAAEGVPVLAHIGEPRAAWLPLDEDDPHYAYYAGHPQYHAYNDPSVPRWEDITAARDRWLERNPDLTVIGAHLGSMAHDVGEIARRLDRYPNFHVETAERFGDLANQDSDEVREFFVRYQDRVLYGTDLGTRSPQEELSAEALREERDGYIERRLRVTWDYLTSGDSLEFVRTGTPFRTRTRGLDLPPEIVRKLYYRNAARILGIEQSAREV